MQNGKILQFERSSEEHPTCMQVFSSAGPEHVAAGAAPSTPLAPAADSHQRSAKEYSLEHHLGKAVESFPPHTPHGD